MLMFTWPAVHGSKNVIRRVHTGWILFASIGALLISLSGVASPALHQARVITVNDGDTITIRMNGREYRTRLVGIDAPEMGQEPWGQRAREHLREILKDMRWNIFVETDIQLLDKYNRLLIYAWDGENRLINEQMLLDGYAVLFTIQPNSRHADRFRKAQQSAREKKVGIWGGDGLKERPLDYKKKHPRE
jgi:micrococcal nuclease